MKKFIVSILILAGIAGVILIVSHNNNSISASALSSGPLSSGVTGTKTNSSVSAINYKDGQYTGSSVDVGYGPVQVKATVAGGKLTDVEFLQMPYDRMHSQQLSSKSEPILKSQAISAQSAQVDGVSGATSTSEGFVKSLSDALSQAS